MLATKNHARGQTWLCHFIVDIHCTTQCGRQCCCLLCVVCRSCFCHPSSKAASEIHFLWSLAHRELLFSFTHMGSDFYPKPVQSISAWLLHQCNLPNSSLKPLSTETQPTDSKRLNNLSPFDALLGKKDRIISVCGNFREKPGTCAMQVIRQQLLGRSVDSADTLTQCRWSILLAFREVSNQMLAVSKEHMRQAQKGIESPKCFDISQLCHAMDVIK